MRWPRPRTLSLLLLLAVVALLIGVNGAVPQNHPGLAPARGPVTVRAKPADALIETMGVAAKIHYASEQDYRVIRATIGGLGVRYLRDGGSGEGYYQRVRELSQRSGFRWTMVMDPRDGFTGSNVPERGIVPIVNQIIAVEGPNEWDVQGNLTYQGQRFPEATRRFQAEMYRAIKNFPAAQPAVQAKVRQVQVLTPSLASYHNAPKQGVVEADGGNMHSYPGGTKALPDQGLDDNLRETRRLLRRSGAPIVATETGYCNQLTPQGCTGQGGVTERAAAKYANRLYLEYFLRGVQRTYLYNYSLDEWSLFLRPNRTLKPAYGAVRDFVRLLQDPGRGLTPGALRYGLTGDTRDVKSLLLQKRNGTFYLVLWANVLSVTPDYKDVETQRSITLTLEQPIARAVAYLPTFQGVSAQKVYSHSRQLVLQVPDHLLVLELRLR